MEPTEEAKRAVLDEQEARAKAYVDFEAGYLTYLGGGSDKDYEVLCKTVTQRFSVSSEEIKRRECEIKEMGEGGDKLCGWVAIPYGPLFPFPFPLVPCFSLPSLPSPSHCLPHTPCPVPPSSYPCIHFLPFLPFLPPLLVFLNISVFPLPLLPLLPLPPDNQF